MITVAQYVVITVAIQLVKLHQDYKLDMMVSAFFLPGFRFLGLLLIVTNVSGFGNLKSPSKMIVRSEKTKLSASFWGNYKSDGKKEGNVVLAIAVLLCIKGNFMSIDVRKTYMCPSGAGSEKVLASLLEQEPSYECLPINELALKFLTAPLVFPGDPKYDPQ